MKSFSGKVAAVTGAGSGIGRALALDLAGRGCHLALCDVDKGALSATAGAARRIGRSGVEVTGARVDVADRDAVYGWAEETAGEHGKVNLIFNNAGVGLGTTIEGADYEDFEWLFGIQLLGRGVRYEGLPTVPEGLRRGACRQRSPAYSPWSASPGQGTYNAAKAGGARLYRHASHGAGDGKTRR